ncbi:MAG: N-acetylneuraminate synthase family protein [Magnetococcales bacterium]|nr:N-acetylneuraminate synthase family protein [Magnetococcales bacterium]
MPPFPQAESRFDFNNLFVLDMANNHQGSVDHGLAMIGELASVIHKQGVRAGIKFQFRQMDQLIHPAHHARSDNRHIPRFLATRLEREAYQKMLDEVRRHKLEAICTPFDEASVDLSREMGFDILKVASCSAKDWPLLEKIADAGLPVIFSTGGLSLRNIDELVSFFEHRGVDFAIMHCVSVYPTPDALCQLNQIDLLRERYPQATIGWSTHEDPADVIPVTMAVAKGARMFERHVGLATESVQLNAYSSTPAQVDAWMSTWGKAVALCGTRSGRPVPTPAERDSLDSLRRGVYAKEPIARGDAVRREQVYFAMPYLEGQLESGHWREGILSALDISPDDPLMNANLTLPQDPDGQVIKAAVHEVKALLNQARVALNSEFEVEYSHHYGIRQFREVGAVIINCINREYCKKIIVMLPGQAHPTHFHKRKEETFQLLHGTMEVSVDHHVRDLRPGETVLVQPGVWHSFRSETGCVFEEISTTHYNDDSYYRDKEINRKPREERKTKVDHWGRWQLPARAPKLGLADEEAETP